MQKLEQAQTSLESGNKPNLAGRPMIVFQSAGVTQLGSNGQSKPDQTRSVVQNKEAINIDDAFADDDDDDDGRADAGIMRTHSDNPETDLGKFIICRTNCCIQSVLRRGYFFEEFIQFSVTAYAW